MVHNRVSADEGHILIGGPGRSGTTLLVQYFTALEFDTGFTVETALAKVDSLSNAGLEHSLGRTLAQGKPMPYVAKSPYFSNKLDAFIASGTLNVKAFILPLRDLHEAAESRRNVSRMAAANGLAERHPGGITRARTKPHKQEERLAVAFYRLVETLVKHNVPTFYLRFPDFALGRQDVFDALHPLMNAHGVTRTESDRAFASVCNPGLISDFGTRNGQD